MFYRFNFPNTKQYYLKLLFILSPLYDCILKHNGFGENLNITWKWIGVLMNLWFLDKYVGVLSSNLKTAK